MLAVLAALAAAAFFACGTSLQHRAVGSLSGSDRSAAHMLTRLVHRPSWLAGIGFSALATCLHAIALNLGDLALVQPIIVSGIVFAVLVRSALDRRLPSRSELAWSAFTWGGLALFIAVVRSSPPHPPSMADAAWFVSAGVGVVAIALLAANTTRSAQRRGLLLGSAAGILFGLVAGLIKVALGQAASGVVHLFAHWSLWLMLALGAWALILNQRAYQATRLSVSMPVLNIVDVMVAIGFGFVVFSERLFSSPFTLGAEIVGLLAIGIGVRQLAAAAEVAPVPLSAPPGPEAANATRTTS